MSSTRLFAGRPALPIKHGRIARDDADGFECAGIELLVRKQQVVDTEGELRRHQQRVAIRRGAPDLLGADKSADTAGAIFHHDVLRQAGTDFLRRDTRQRIGGAAGRQRHDDGDRPVWESSAREAALWPP